MDKHFYLMKVNNGIKYVHGIGNDKIGLYFNKTDTGVSFGFMVYNNGHMYIKRNLDKNKSKTEICVGITESNYNISFTYGDFYYRTKDLVQVKVEFLD